MEFLFGCLLFGLGFAVLCGVASATFWDTKDRRDEKKLHTANWKTGRY